MQATGKVTFTGRKVTFTGSIVSFTGIVKYHLQERKSQKLAYVIFPIYHCRVKQLKTVIMELFNLNQSIAYCEAKGLANCFESYANEFAGEDILEIGFNPNSGYVYIALETGISICSQLGEQVELLITNEDGTEEFFDTKREAIEYLHHL